MARFYEAAKRNQLKHAIGYIQRLEYTPAKGLHLHCYYFFNANDHREDITWGQYIAEKWKIATNNLGSAFICNMKRMSTAIVLWAFWLITTMKCLRTSKLRLTTFVK